MEDFASSEKTCLHVTRMVRRCFKWSAVKCIRSLRVWYTNLWTVELKHLTEIYRNAARKNLTVQSTADVPTHARWGILTQRHPCTHTHTHKLHLCHVFLLWLFSRPEGAEFRFRLCSIIFSSRKCQAQACVTRYRFEPALLLRAKQTVTVLNGLPVVSLEYQEIPRFVWYVHLYDLDF